MTAKQQIIDKTYYQITKEQLYITTKEIIELKETLNRISESKKKTKTKTELKTFLKNLIEEI